MVSLIDLGPTAMALAGIPVPTHMQGQPILGQNSRTRDYIISARDRCDMTIDWIRCVRTPRNKYIRNFYPELPYNQFSRYKDFFYPVQNLMTVLHKQNMLTPEQEKFMEPSKSCEELYDLVNDPHELYNLAEDPAHEGTLKKLSGILEKWMEETGDLGGQKEDPQILANEAEARRKRYEMLWGKRGFPPDIEPEEYLKFWEKEVGIEN